VQEHSIAGGVQITQFQHHHFATWQDKNVANLISIAHLGSDRDTFPTQIGTINTTDKSAISVQLCSTNQRLYML